MELRRIRDERIIAFEKARGEREEKREKEIEEAKEAFENLDISKADENKFENDRHRVIVAKVISDFFLFMLRHFKNNRKYSSF